MIRILFNGHDFKFLQPLINHYQQSSNYSVSMDRTNWGGIVSKAESLALLKDADVIFCEWSLGNAVWYSENKLPEQKLIIRLHHQEINLHFLNQIRWENVDRIVFICPENMEIFSGRFPMMALRSVLIYNLIDCGSLDLKKQRGSAFNLGFIGTSPLRKAPHHALELFERLKLMDDRYMLFFKGKHPWEYAWLWEREEERKYFESLYERIRQSRFSSSIVFDPHGNDMPDWFSKIGVILSTSDHEGSHQAVAEGMAAGCLPVIRNWAGADKIYPSRYVVRTVSEAAGMVRRWYLDGQFDKLGGEVRSFAQQNFDILPITSQYDQLISRLTGIEFQPCRISDGNAIKDEAIRLAFVCYLTPGKQSGYEIRVTEEAGLLSRHGITPWIVVFFSAKNNSPVEELEWYRKEMETKTGSRIKLMPTDHYFHLHDSEGLFKEIDKPMVDFIRQEKINILHAEALYAAHHCSRISVKTGCRLVFDNHGALPEETKMRGGNQNWIRRLEEVENQLLIDADLTVLVSHGMQNFYRTRYGVTLDTAQILPCCVHSDAFSLLPELRTRVRAEKGLSDRFVMLYLGTLSVWQWPDAMFGLFARIQQKFPDTFLYMLIPEYDHEAARNYLSTYGIPEDCYLLEEVPHQEVGHHIGLADAGFLLRETHEVNKVSSPTKFGEYLAAGVPVILTQGIGDYSDMADRMQVGLTLNMTSAEVSAEDFSRIESFIQNVKENRRIWSERCTGVAKRNLDWEKFGDILIRKYLRMINNNI